MKGQGICPKCDSLNLDYQDVDDCSDSGKVYQFVCNECGCEACEHYDLVYVETLIV